MKSIEFIGAPGSGKTYFKEQLNLYYKNKNIKSYDYNEFFLSKYNQLHELNIFENQKFFFKKITLNNKNFFLKYLNYKLDQIFSFKKEYEKINNNIYTKNFFKEYFIKLKFENRSIKLQNKINKWLVSELSAINISLKIRSSKEILINSEGINQRIIRLILNIDKNKIKSFLKKIKYQKFESDIVIFVNTKPSICIKRIKKRKEKKYSSADINNFYLKSKYIFKNTKKKKFIINDKMNINYIFKKIYEN